MRRGSRAVMELPVVSEYSCTFPLFLYVLFACVFVSRSINMSDFAACE